MPNFKEPVSSLTAVEKQFFENASRALGSKTFGFHSRIADRVTRHQKDKAKKKEVNQSTQLMRINYDKNQGE